MTPPPPTNHPANRAAARELVALAPWRQPQIATPHTYLSLGAGVQSSALALMLADGDFPDITIKAAVFADTGAEPPAVYAWLQTLNSLIQAARHPFPVVTVGPASLRADSLAMITKPDGRKFSRTTIPFFTRGPDGRVGIIRQRACTRDYKIRPIEAWVRKDAGVRHKQYKITVTQLIGISLDEIERANPARAPWSQNRWPLLELRMTRADCLRWFSARAYPTPPRSACYFCPYRSDAEWDKLATTDPETFAAAVAYEQELQIARSSANPNHPTIYCHRSGQPLATMPFRRSVQDAAPELDFLTECQGMCGH